MLPGGGGSLPPHPMGDMEWGGLCSPPGFGAPRSPPFAARDPFPSWGGLLKAQPPTPFAAPPQQGGLGAFPQGWGSALGVRSPPRDLLGCPDLRACSQGVPTGTVLSLGLGAPPLGSGSWLSIAPGWGARERGARELGGPWHCPTPQHPAGRVWGTHRGGRGRIRPSSPGPGARGLLFRPAGKGLRPGGPWARGKRVSPCHRVTVSP